MSDETIEGKLNALMVEATGRRVPIDEVVRDLCEVLVERFKDDDEDRKRDDLQRWRDATQLRNAQTGQAVAERTLFSVCEQRAALEAKVAELTKERDVARATLVSVRLTDLPNESAQRIIHERDEARLQLTYRTEERDLARKERDELLSLRDGMERESPTCWRISDKHYELLRCALSDGIAPSLLEGAKLIIHERDEALEQRDGVIQERDSLRASLEQLAAEARKLGEQVRVVHEASTAQMQKVRDWMAAKQ